MNKKGEVATAVVVTLCFIVGVVAHAFGTGQVNYPDFKAKPKTIDTLENPAPPDWER